MFVCMYVVETYACLFLLLYMIILDNHAQSFFNDSYLLICYEYYCCMKINFA